MSKRYLSFALLVFVLSAHVPPGRAQSSLTEGPLSAPAATSPHPLALDNDAVIRMTRAGLDASLILQTVRAQPGKYRVGPDDLITLKQANVPQPVIAAMMARNSGLAEHPSADNPVAVSPLSPDVDELGVYHKEHNGQWVLVNPELVHYKSGGWAKSTLTHGIIKKDRNGEISGGQSALVLKPGDELLILAPPNVDPVEYQLLRFRMHAGSREFRASTGGVFTTRDGTDRDQVPIHPTRVAARIYSFTIPDNIGGGEFGVLPPGAASTPGIAFAGKMYTFAIVETK